jgi:hypothetical protein
MDSTPDNGERVGLAEAGRRLGISAKTARRRVKAGRLRGRQVGTQHGPTWQAWVPAGVDAAGRVDSQGTQAATLLEPVKLVSELQAKAEASAMWQARAELLAHQLGEARERIRMLEAPREDSPIGETEPDPAPVPEPLTPTPDGRKLPRSWRRAIKAWLWLASSICALVAAYLLAEAAFAPVDVGLPLPRP